MVTQGSEVHSTKNGSTKQTESDLHTTTLLWERKPSRKRDARAIITRPFLLHLANPSMSNCPTLMPCAPRVTY